ncbi:hypothetical protein BDW74DRAFT_143075 [Aspergillus multicolor]|uniref:uncharacterized protein n=1 Tax=Aspergillus multicolor TaxID=41759 RepID=UPI003CCDED1E
MAAILSPTKASRDTRNNPAAVDALNPPPPLPSLMITREVGRHWSDSRLRPSAASGLHGLASTLDAASDVKEVVDDQKLVLQDSGQETDTAMSLSWSYYTESWNAPLYGAPSAFINQHSAPSLKTHDLSSISLSNGRGDLITMPFDYGRPTRSPSHTSSSWAMSVAGSDSDSSIASDEEQQDNSPGLNERSSSVVNAPPAGPCSKAWSLPPRTRRKRKSTPEDSSKKKHRKSSTRRRGPFKDESKRTETALTRNLKGCVRCRMMRIRCEPDHNDPYTNDCLTCQKAHHSKAPSIRKLPCLRMIITDVSLYREQEMPCQLFSRRWQSMEIVDITDWASSEIKTITLSQIHVDAPYNVQVRKFIPIEGDMLESTWSSGHYVRRHPMPQYALADMEGAAETLKWLTANYVGAYIKYEVGNLDLLIWRTYYFAFTYQQKAKPPRERALIRDCLQFWVGCRKISNPEYIRYYYDAVGGTPVDDPASPYHEKVPMPGIMIAQMECIMYTRVLRPLCGRVLTGLKDLITENKREHWLTIYLTLFVLLHSCAMLTRRDWETAREFGLQSVYANRLSIEGMQKGMQTALAHFHYLNKGVLPFHLTYDEKSLRHLATAADLDSEELEFVKETSQHINHPTRAAHMADIRTNRKYGDDLYWISQLYDVEWSPGPTV